MAEVARRYLDGSDMSDTLTSALADMAKELSVTEGAFAHLTCGETDSVVKVLALAGHRDAAVAVVLGHAMGDGWGAGDELGDAHYAVVQASDVKEGAGGGADIEVARAYVDALVDR